MTFELSPLPYADDALEPFMTAATLNVHHGAHHAGYVDKLNKLIAGSSLAKMGLPEIIAATARNKSQGDIFNNAAQVWNHTFFWNAMAQNGGGAPTGEIATAVDKTFGGFDAFRTQFVEAAMGHFGSGWVWLIAENAHLKIITTPNAMLPMAKGQQAILACDLWEHAYYLDYQNRRKEYVETFLDALVNWEFANQNLRKTRVGKAA